MTKEQQRLIDDIAKFTATWREAPVGLLGLVGGLAATAKETGLSIEHLADAAADDDDLYEFVDGAVALLKLRENITDRSYRLIVDIWDGLDNKKGTSMIEAVAIKAQRGDPFAQWIASEMQDKTSFIHGLLERPIPVSCERAAAARRH
jgi:hypothetical protein